MGRIALLRFTRPRPNMSKRDRSTSADIEREGFVPGDRILTCARSPRTSMSTRRKRTASAHPHDIVGHEISSRISFLVVLPVVVEVIQHDAPPRGRR